MAWRFLVDEDTDTRTVDELGERGFDAVTIAAAVGKGASDERVVEFANREDRILITADRDFLVPSHRLGIRVFMVANADAAGYEIADRAAELATLADGPADLKPVTWI